MAIVDGKAIALSITKEVGDRIKEQKLAPKMAVIACDPNFETKKYLALKQAKAQSLGINLETLILPKDSDTDSILKSIEEQTVLMDGIIVQLPLPDHIDTQSVLNSIPKEKDVDAFNYSGENTTVLPPVVGAIDEISKHYDISWEGKTVAIFGYGRLVGMPAELYAKQKGAKVVVFTKEKTDLGFVKTTDIIILGVGQPDLLTSEMVKDSVIIFDAGASEDGGVLVGDASPEVAKKALLFTPVPGGIGPITIAVLFRNLLELMSKYN